MPDQNQILLQTKLHQPRLPKGLITRSRLVERLTNDMDHQLTLVCAPAGFGKTTLISSWLRFIAASHTPQAASMPAAWLSLDENDSDLNLFMRYFIAALRTVFSEACEETLALFQVQQPPQAVLFATFINELERLPGDVILVLDDYHTLRGMEVHNLLGELVQHWPETLHLVLISRLNPPLPLSKLRARGMLSEFRARDLRFTTDEMDAFLSQSQIALPSQNVLDLLEERFEGWPAGLHLAVLSFRSADSQKSVLEALSSENTNITRYLVDEVLSQQFPAIHTFLLKTSILNRLCAGLCEAILGEVDPAWDARACLDWIERTELFFTPLDDRREWYRYHHLFQELLQQRAAAELVSGEINRLHLRASAWFEAQGFIDEALQHALAAGDLDLVAHQMITGLREVINCNDRPTLERWLRLLPDEVIQRDPGLLMIRAWSLQFLWRHDLQAQVLQRIEELLDAGGGAALPAEDRQLLRGQILALRAQQVYFSNQPARAIDLCQDVLAHMPHSWTFVRGGAILYLGLAMQASGQVQEAERLLLDAYESCSDKTDQYALRILNSLCFIYLNTGRLEQVRQVAQVLNQGAIRSGLTIPKDYGDYMLGLVCYQRNELEAAAQHFSRIADRLYTSAIIIFRQAVAGLALIHEIKGESPQALQMLEAISQFDLEQIGSEDERTRSLRARLMLLQGDLESAGLWVDTYTNPPPDKALLWLEEPQVTRVRVLLARGSESDLRLALQISDDLEEIARRTSNIRYQIELLALRALVLDALGETRPADASLKQALDLALPGGFIRVFVDLGEPMQALLRRLAGHDDAAETIHRILAAFPAEAEDQDSGQSLARQPARAGSMLAEPLTPRELEVLGLLREPLSTKEIARKLNVSPATAKRHIANIYAKLGVNQRWKAVATAEELNILHSA